MLSAIFIVIAILIGSIPFGRLTSALFNTHGRDDLLFGTGNPSTYSLFQLGQKKAAWLTFILDIAKPSIVFGLTLGITKQIHLATLCASLTTLAMLYPPLLKGKPNKSILPLIALCFAFAPISAFIAAVIYGATLKFSQRLMLSSLSIILFVPFLTFFFNPSEAYAFYMFAICIASLANNRAVFNTALHRYPSTNILSIKDLF